MFETVDLDRSSYRDESKVLAESEGAKGPRIIGIPPPAVL